MIYNSSKSNKVLAILDFGADITSTASTFTVTLPAAGAGTAVIRAV
jgi:O-glycosyl hydrolase